MFDRYPKGREIGPDRRVLSGGVLTISAISFFLMTTLVYAHPLGNFSLNQFFRIEVARSEIRIHQVLDMAEIPTFQESYAIDADKNGALDEGELDSYLTGWTPDYLSRLSLNVGDEPVELKISEKKISLLNGAGDLPTLRIELDLIAPLRETDSPQTAVFQNSNYPERVGWREMIVNASAGVTIYNSSANANGVSDELRSYPEDLLSAPLNERSSQFSITHGNVPEGAAALRTRDGRPAVSAPKDRLAELISVPEITPMVALFGLLAAFGLGAIHAMSPGHGKTVVGAYLVGSRGTAKHALFLGLTVTITHTLGVFALGLVTLLASNYVLPERIMPFLSFVSGLLVFFIGISLFKERLFAVLGWNKPDAHAHHDHTHPDGEIAHTHDGIEHTHGGTTHSHAPPESITWKGLLALGVSGGLLPCPSALVLMLSAISLGRTGYGLILTVVFSVGLAATLTVIGLLFLYIGNAVDKTSFSNNRVVKALPVFSAFVVAFVGAVICYQSLA